jgi:predicted kinase
MVTLLVGSTGAGKTTYGLKLQKELPAVLYSIDNWMKDLWGDDMPKDPEPAWFHENHEWYVERIKRCEKKIVSLAAARAKIGQKSILDFGFSTREHRKSILEALNESKVQTKIIWLDVPAHKRWERVQSRNSEKGETYVMNVDQSLFEYMENIFEAPSKNEAQSFEIVKQ